MNLARVTAVHPETNKVDLLFIATGQRVPGVRVMCSDASSASGTLGLATPDAQLRADPFAPPASGERTLIACVGYYDGQPVVQGFIFPEVAELLFPDADRVMHRTPSDFYHTVDGKGNAEWVHPSGAYVRIGVGAAHENLTGKDRHKKFRVRRNTDKKVNIHIAQAGGTASVDIGPDGAITILTKQGVALQAAKSVRIKAGGVDVDTPMLRVSGGITSGIGITGSFTTTTGNVVTVEGGIVTNIA